ncbi:bestrophin family protein [Marinimicrobium alkaliphilum]|uniref:bestrophin family protein n=1 Tax=Marinimicrobium alkaliphilum TaxID=2202654 RepID=UPI000DB8F89F|nr:bestrophin family ion channel [Marinimicrobium alkaliphilum]
MIITRRISLTKLVCFTWPQLLALAGFILLACVAMAQIPQEGLRALSFAAGFLGTALAFLIGFRNNTAYSRWWEGHQIWSQLKYHSRSFALLVQGLVAGSEALDREQRALIYRQIAFAWRLNQYLRKIPAGEEQRELLADDESASIEQQATPPLAILHRQNQRLHALLAQGDLDSYQHLRLLDSLEAFNQVLSSCERLKKTPFPMQYTWFMNYTLTVFLFVLPVSLAGHLGYLSIPFSLLIGYAYIMLEYVGRHIERPFDNTVNDVPMDYIARTIEIDLRQLLGESDLPAPIKPRGKGYLY